MVDPVEDWSEVRSPARARRRRKLGFPQRVKIIYVPKRIAYAMDGGRTMVMHPTMRRELEREAAKDEEQRDTEKFLRENRPEPDSTSPWRIETGTWSSIQNLRTQPLITTVDIS